MDMLLIERDTNHRKKVPFAIWDTAGMEKFRSMSPFYYKGTKCILIVFDISNKNSFEKVSKWHDEFKNFANFKAKMFLVGNKKDLGPRDVPSIEQIEEMTKKKKFIKYFEVSAMENKNKEIDAVFKAMFEAIVEEDWEKSINKHEGLVIDSESIAGDNDTGQKKGCC